MNFYYPPHGLTWPKPMLFGQMIILASSSHHVIILWFGKRWPPTDFSRKKKPVTENKLP